MPTVPLTHPSTVGAASSARERVEKYLDQAGAAGVNQNQAALYGAMCVALLDVADAVRHHSDATVLELQRIHDRIDRGLPHLRDES